MTTIHSTATRHSDTTCPFCGGNVRRHADSVSGDWGGYYQSREVLVIYRCESCGRSPELEE